MHPRNIANKILQEPCCRYCAGFIFCDEPVLERSATGVLMAIFIIISSMVSAIRDRQNYLQLLVQLFQQIHHAQLKHDR